MSHTIRLLVEVELERTSGKFAGRDEMAESLISEVENADPGYVGGIGADGDSEYDVVAFEVEEFTDSTAATIRGILHHNVLHPTDRRLTDAEKLAQIARAVKGK